MSTIRQYLPHVIDLAFVEIITGSFLAATFLTKNNPALITIRKIALHNGLTSSMGQIANQQILSFIKNAKDVKDDQKIIKGAKLSILTGCLLLAAGVNETINLLSSHTPQNLEDPAQLAYGVATVTSIFHQIYLGANLISLGSDTAAEA